MSLLTVLMDFEGIDGSIEENIEGNEYDFNKTMAVLQTIATKKATYGTEIAQKNRIDRKTVSNILHELEDKGYIERLIPKKKNNDQRLLDRRTHMFRNSMKGLEGASSPKWYGLNSEHDWSLKVNNDNTSVDFVDEYHREVDFEPEKSTAEFVAEKVRMG